MNNVKASILHVWPVLCVSPPETLPAPCGQSFITYYKGEEKKNPKQLNVSSHTTRWLFTSRGINWVSEEKQQPLQSSTQTEGASVKAPGERERSAAGRQVRLGKLLSADDITQYPRSDMHWRSVTASQARFIWPLGRGEQHELLFVAQLHIFCFPAARASRNDKVHN